MENCKKSFFLNLQYRNTTKKILQFFSANDVEIFISPTEICFNEEVQFFKQLLFCQVPSTSLDDEFCDILLAQKID